MVGPQALLGRVVNDGEVIGAGGIVLTACYQHQLSVLIDLLSLTRLDEEHSDDEERWIATSIAQMPMQN